MMRNHRFHSFLLSVIFALGLAVLFGVNINAFQKMPLTLKTGSRITAGRKNGMCFRSWAVRTKHNSSLFASPSDEESESVQRLFEYDSSNFDNKLDGDDLEEIELGQPPEWMVMQQVNSRLLHYQLSA